MVNRDQSSFWNCAIMLFVVTTRMRLPLPRLISSLSSMPISIVLPRPTASAIENALPGLFKCQ